MNSYSSYEDANDEEFVGGFWYKEEMSDQDLGLKLSTLYINNLTAWNTQLNSITLCNKFFLGEQWSSEELERLTESKRPIGIWNFCKPIINQIVGSAQNRFQRTSFSYSAPRFDQTNVQYDKLLEMVNNMFMFYYDRGGFYHKLFEAFQHSLIHGLSLIQITPHNNSIKADFYDAFSFMIDPATRNSDLSDCCYVIITYKVNKDVLMTEYPAFEENINNSSLFFDQRTVQTTPLPAYRDDRTVIEYWIRTPENIENMYNGDIVVVKVLKPCNTILSRKRFKACVFPFTLVVPMMITSSITLSQKFYPIISDIIGQQQYINRLYSVLTKTIINGYTSIMFYDQDCLLDPNALKNGNTAGSVATKRNIDLSKAVKVVEAGSGSSSLAKIIESVINTIHQTSGVVPTSFGDSGEANKTASLFEQKEFISDETRAVYYNGLKKAQEDLTKKLSLIALQYGVFGEYCRSILGDNDDYSVFGDKKYLDYESLSMACQSEKMVGIDEIKSMVNIINNSSVIFTHLYDSSTRNEAEFQKRMALLQAQVPQDARQIYKSANFSNVSDDLQYLDKLDAEAQQQAQQQQMMQQVAEQQAVGGQGGI